MLDLAVVLLLSLLLAGGATWATGWVRARALSKGMLDIPNERSSHIAATPRGGGIAIVAAFFLGTFALFASGLLPAGMLGIVLLSSGLVAWAGWVDDLHHLSAWIRFSVQLLAAVMATGFVLYGTHEPSFLTVGVLVVGAIAIVALTNFYNFMDGIDGIAAAEGVLVAFSAALLLWMNGDDAFALWMVVLGSSVAGFLYWNWAPAKIFMGDVGSGFLGFLFACMVLLSVSQGGLSLPVWLILLGLFIVDAGVTLVRRFLSGERWYEAHRSHAYQNLSRRLGSHSPVVVIAILVNLLWLFPWAYVANQFEDWGCLAAVIALAPLAVGALSQGAGTEKY